MRHMDNMQIGKAKFLSKAGKMRESQSRSCGTIAVEKELVELECLRFVFLF